MNAPLKLAGYAGVLAVTFAAAYAVGGAITPLNEPTNLSPPTVQQMSAPVSGVGSDAAGSWDGSSGGTR